MLDLKKLPELILKKTQGKPYVPKHIIINLGFPKRDELDEKDAHQKNIDKIIEIVKSQVELDIPIMTISLDNWDHIKHTMVIHEFLDVTLKEYAEKNRIRTTFLGHWYGLPGMIVEAMKRLINATYEFDQFFLNFCVNYDGQQEIADACKVIITKGELKKIDKDSIGPEMIKEHIYSSYFLPPDLIIELEPRLSGTFLWDSKGARIVFLNKRFDEVTKADITKSIDQMRR